MKKKLFLLFFYLVSAVSMIDAQDVILKVNGEEILVKLLEVNTGDVKYKKFNNEFGPTYTLLQSEIFMIKYENGEIETFNKTATNVSSNPKKYYRKDPGLAFLFSMLYPGMGQIYCGKVSDGIVLAVVSTVSFTLTFLPIIDGNDYRFLFGIATGGIYIASLIDAPVSAGRINRRNALSWNIGEKNTLSLNPDVLTVNSLNGATNYQSASFGLSLKFDF